MAFAMNGVFHIDCDTIGPTEVFALEEFSKIVDYWSAIPGLSGTKLDSYTASLLDHLKSWRCPSTAKFDEEVLERQDTIFNVSGMDGTQRRSKKEYGGILRDVTNTKSSEIFTKNSQFGTFKSSKKPLGNVSNASRLKSTGPSVVKLSKYFDNIMKKSTIVGTKSKSTEESSISYKEDGFLLETAAKCGTSSSYALEFEESDTKWDKIWLGLQSYYENTAKLNKNFLSPRETANPEARTKSMLSKPQEVFPNRRESTMTYSVPLDIYTIADIQAHQIQLHEALQKLKTRSNSKVFLIEFVIFAKQYERLITDPLNNQFTKLTLSSFTAQEKSTSSRKNLAQASAGNCTNHELPNLNTSQRLKLVDKETVHQKEFEGAIDRHCSMYEEINQVFGQMFGSLSTSNYNKSFTLKTAVGFHRSQPHWIKSHDTSQCRKI